MGGWGTFISTHSSAVVAEVLFWLSAAWILYATALYPVLAFVLASSRPARKAGALAHPLPPVSWIIAACNEEASIGSALRAATASDYPPGRREILVVSDGSTDGTDRICLEFERHGVRLLRAGGPLGKNAAIDLAVRHARGTVLVFSDATTRFAPHTLRRLVSHFADPTVGCVGGRLVYGSRRWEGAAAQHTFRWADERLRQAESRLGYVPSVSGAVHALRRELYRSVDPGATRDIADPASAALSGLRVLVDRTCVADESASTSSLESARGRVRMTLRGMSAASTALRQLVVRRCWLAAWLLVSHKMMRWWLWLPVLLAWLTSGVLALQGPNWAAAWLAQSAGHLASGVAASLALAGSRSRLAQVLGFPLLALGAMAWGCGRACVGGTAAIWTPDRVQTLS